MIQFFKEYTWQILIGCALGIPLIVYLSGYFWTRGSMNAKTEFLNQELIKLKTIEPNKPTKKGD